MNSNNLITINDSDLDQVAGGIGAVLDLGRAGSASLTLGEDGLTTTLSFFDHLLDVVLNLKATVK